MSKSIQLFIFVLCCLISITFSCVCNHGTCMGDTCVCNQYYEGSDCSIYNREITSAVPISDTISEYNWKYYHFNVESGQTSLTITLTQTSSSGDVDIYLSTSAYPSATNYFMVDDSSDSRITLEIPSLNFDTYYIGLYGYSPCSYDLEVVAKEGCINNCNGNGECDLETLSCLCFIPYIGTDCSIYDAEISLGITYHGQLKSHQWIYYHFTSTDIENLSVIMTQLTGSSNQLFIQQTYYPEFFAFAYANTTISTQVEVHVQNLDPGYWVIGLYGYTGGLYSLTVTLDTPVKRECTNDCSHHGVCDYSDITCDCEEGYLGPSCEYMVSLAEFQTTYDGYVSQGNWNYYPVQFVTSASIRVQLTKTNGNCNLFIRPSTYPSRVAYQYSDVSSDQVVNLDIQYPGSNVWYVGVYGYSDCNYDLQFDIVSVCGCGENGNGYCEPGSTSCICDIGFAGTACDIEATRLSSYEVHYDTVTRGQMKYFYVNSNSSALVITMEEKNTKSFVWLLIGTDGYPSLDNYDSINYGYAGEASFHENRFLFSSKKPRTHYIAVLGSNLDVSPDPVQFAITVYSTPF